MRKSLELVKDMVDTTKSYKGLVDDLKPFYAYLSDCGHSLMVIPKSLIGKYPDADLWELESAVPVKYVLDKEEYSIFNGHLIVDVPFSDEFGVDVDEYMEF